MNFPSPVLLYVLLLYSIRVSAVSHIISMQCHMRYILKQCSHRKNNLKSAFARKAKILGSLIWCVCVCICTRMHTHVQWRETGLKNTLCWNIPTFSLAVLHVPYARDSGFQISNLYFPCRASQCDSKIFHRNTSGVCVTIQSISMICCNVFKHITWFC
jgi:hypothetical protein